MYICAVFVLNCHSQRGGEGRRGGERRRGRVWAAMITNSFTDALLVVSG